MFPAASRACAVTVCLPFVANIVFQLSSYGAVVSSAPSCEPSTKNCTRATPTLSAAVAVTIVVPETVAPLDGDVMATVGGVVSAGVPPPGEVTSNASTTT